MRSVIDGNSGGKQLADFIWTIAAQSRQPYSIIQGGTGAPVNTLVAIVNIRVTLSRALSHNHLLTLVDL